MANTLLVLQWKTVICPQAPGSLVHVHTLSCPAVARRLQLTAHQPTNVKGAVCVVLHFSFLPDHTTVAHSGTAKPFSPMAHVAPTPAPDQEVHSEEPPTGGVCHLPICVFTTTTFNVDFVETLFLCISVSVIVSIYKGLPCVKKFCSVPFSYFVSWSLHFHGCDGLDTFGTFNLNLHRPFREKGVNV